MRCKLATPSAGVMLLLAGGLVLGPGYPLLPAVAATPPNGTVSEFQTVEWDGDAGFTPTADTSCHGPANPACDNFALAVVVPAVAPDGYFLSITLQPDATDDWDLEVYNAAGQLMASSGNGGASMELVVLNNPPAGSYTVAASPFAGALGYEAAAQITLGPSTITPVDEPVAFYSYVDPARHDARGPSVGVNWQSESGGPAGPPGPLGADNGGTGMFISGLSTLRVRFNDCTAPATYLGGGDWQDVSPTSHILSVGPALFTDGDAGRTFAAQGNGASALFEQTDDDGANWTPGLAGASAAGEPVIGGGRLAEPLFSVLDGNNPSYNDFAHGVYVCTHEIALASCSLSVDGGTTFGAQTPVWTLAMCGGPSGRLQVSPLNGAAYLPSRSCGGEQGVAASTDNGLSWSVLTVPGSGNGEWDPSVGVGADGTLYFGFELGGKPMVAVSVDGGVTWSPPVDVGFGGILTTAFPAMVAGDGDRAAFAFLGSTTSGALGANTLPAAVWHLYVAMTFDRGITWTTANVTGADPVQRGAICNAGTACPSNANLGNFIDIQMDRRGRPVIGYADGCVDQCVTTPTLNTRSAVATIARLKSFKGLLAAHDAERAGVPDLPLSSATLQGLDVELEWSEPGDGGNAITGYKIRKNGFDLATVGPEFHRFTDVGGLPTAGDYEVFAQNAVGDSRVKTGCNASLFLVTDPCPPFCPGHCQTTGATVLTDPAGDSDAGLGTGFGPGAYDLLRLGISESFLDYGSGAIAFVVEVQNTGDLPPDSIWPVTFRDAGGADRFARMDTMSGSPVFSYGTGTDINPVTNPGTVAAGTSGIVGNNIVIVVPRTGVGAEIGESISDFLVRVRVNAGAATLTPDNMPNSLVGQGSYQVFGSENCNDIDVPLVMDDKAITNACTTADIDVLANDFDPGGNGLQIVGASRPANGETQVVSGAGGDRIFYHPATGFTGLDFFTYTVSNGAGGEATATVTVTVEATADGDTDGVMDSCDNCLIDSNADQCNTNAETDDFGNFCDADLDNNGIVNSGDLSILRASFGASGENDADLDCNGVVNSGDLSIMRTRFGAAPGPTGLAGAP